MAGPTGEVKGGPQNPAEKWLTSKSWNEARALKEAFKRRRFLYFFLYFLKSFFIFCFFFWRSLFELETCKLCLFGPQIFFLQHLLPEERPYEVRCDDETLIRLQMKLRDPASASTEPALEDDVQSCEDM